MVLLIPESMQPRQLFCLSLGTPPRRPLLPRTQLLTRLPANLLCPCLPQNVRTPLDMVRSPSLPYAELFEQPLSMFFFWVFPNYSKPYDETLELATYLLQK